MSAAVIPLFDQMRSQIRLAPAARRLGRVASVTGLIVESDGPNVGLGELCTISSARNAFSVQAEVVGFRDEKALLMPLGPTAGLHAGCEVAATDRPSVPKADAALLGRVIDALGRPIDDLGPVALASAGETSAAPVHPLRRQRIKQPIATGVRALDAFAPSAAASVSAFSPARAWANPLSSA